MSIATCELCDKVIDTDFHTECDGDGRPICNECVIQLLQVEVDYARKLYKDLNDHPKN